MRYPCECSDPGCPVHKGQSECNVPTKGHGDTLYRSDMEDNTGTFMCDGCAEDAMSAGVFYTK